MSTRNKTYPASVKHGIPKLGPLQPGWQRFRIGDLLEEVPRPVQMDDHAKYDLVTVKRSRGGAVKRETLRGRDIAVKTQFRIEANDFLISKRQIVHGACAVVPASLDGSIVSNEYAVLRCRPNIDIKFLNYLSHSIYFQETCFHSSIGVHVEKMIFKLEDWLNCEIDIPVGEEQRQIKDFLCAVDLRLSALLRKRRLLADFKRGVVQQIFTQQIRFKCGDGSDFPDWEEKKLGRIAERISAKFDPSASNAKPIVIELENIESESGSIVEAKKLLNQKSLMTEFQSGDVLFGKLRPYLKKYAMPEFNGVCSSEIWVLRGREIGNLFLYYLVQTQKFLRFSNQSSGSKMPRADWGLLEETSFDIPHPDEQRKIADFLSALDAKIDMVARQITQTEAFKKGLLQKMFV